MQQTVNAINHLDNSRVYLTYENETECPICKAIIFPVHLAASFNTKFTASVFNYCQSCQETFVTQYRIAYQSNSSVEKRIIATETLYSEPNRFSSISFDGFIEQLSPQFVKIYNQAEKAECLQLDEIAGLGYRKALEFLVKDYATHILPDKEDCIKTKPLSTCIKEYISDPKITVLAEKSAWIGNDEAHYVRQHEDLDISDLKRFIMAIVYFVNMNLITEEADSIKK